MFFGSCRDSAKEKSIRNSPKHINILLLTLDTTRRDRLGAYGSTRGLTPNLDRISKQGIVFLDARTQVPITLPSHSSIMTGLGVLDHGVRENGTFIVPNDAQTIAKTLSNAGYRTAAFVSSFVLDKRFGIAQGFKHYDDEMTKSWGGGTWQGIEVDVFERPANETTDAAIEWLKQAIEDSEKGPFFVWVHYFDPHQKWEPPEPWSFRCSHPYDGEIAFMDDQIGRLLDLLESKDIVDNTLVIAVSDHGESLGEHGLQGHGWDIYDQAMRTVWVMQLPGKPAKGRSIFQRVGLYDLPATMLDIIGKSEINFSGKSLWPLVTGRYREKVEDPFYMETMLPALRNNAAIVYGLLEGRWKIVLKHKGDDESIELYDIDRDAAEMKNLAQIKTEHASKLKTALTKKIADSLESKALKQSSMDKETEQKLRALGYIGD